MNKILLLLMLTISPLSHAQLYKWVDDNGQTHYSEHRPNNVEATTIKEQRHKVSKPYTPSRKDTQKAILDQAKNADDEKKKAQEETTNKQDKDRYCSAQQKRLATFNSGRRIRTQNDSGEYAYVDEIQRQAQITEIKKGIAKHCQ